MDIGGKFFHCKKIMASVKSVKKNCFFFFTFVKLVPFNKGRKCVIKLQTFIIIHLKGKKPSVCSCIIGMARIRNQVKDESSKQPWHIWYYELRCKTVVSKCVTCLS